MAVSKRTRFEIFKRDEFTCQYCGRTPPKVILHCDHINPVSNGGLDDELNLVTSCMDCNLGKSDVLLEQIARPIIEQQQQTIEKKEQLQAYSAYLEELRANEDQLIEDLGSHWYGLIEGKESKYVFGRSRISGIRTFTKNITSTEIKDAMELAITRKGATVKNDDYAFRYFCGICWRKIRELRGEETE